MVFPRKCPILCFGARGFVRVSSGALILLRDVTGKPSLRLAVLVSLLERGNAERLAGVVIAVLNNYFRWSLRPAMLRR